MNPATMIPLGDECGDPNGGPQEPCGVIQYIHCRGQEKRGERCALGFRKNTVFRCLDYSRPAVPAMDGPAPRETSIGDGNAQNSLQKSSYLRRRDQVRHPRGGRLWRPCKRNSLDYGRDPKSSNDKNVSMQEEFPRVSCLHRTPADGPYLPIQPQDPGSNYEPGAPSVLF